ncbi:CsbD family protein [Yinghuangia sp. YIM S09857]|uniref:CsbD family protein n=1 Tax=Yinghuangia sp. YIM S09857 TaxID=3436929 RepID=UPI003F53DF17
MGFKSAKDELKGRAKELAGRATGNEQRRRDGEEEHQQAKAEGLAEADAATRKSAAVTDPSSSDRDGGKHDTREAP